MRITQKDAQKQFENYFKSVKAYEPLSTLSLISLVLSSLFISKVFDFFILNLAYLINISFFALIARDSWNSRRKNMVPLIAISLSILLSCSVMVDLIKVVDMFNSMGDAFQ